MAKKKDFSAAGAELDKLFSESSESPAKSQRKDDTSPSKKALKNENKTVKKVFSFRAPSDMADDWRIWADAKGMKVDELGTKALSEYIKRHPLTDDQSQIYELKKAQKKS